MTKSSKRKTKKTKNLITPFLIKLIKPGLILLSLTVITFIAYNYFFGKKDISDGMGGRDYSIVMPQEKFIPAIDSCHYTASRKKSVNGIWPLPDPWIEVTYSFDFNLQFFIKPSADIEIEYNKDQKAMNITVKNMTGNEFVNYNAVSSTKSGNGWNQKADQPQSYLGQHLKEISRIAKMAEYATKDAGYYGLEGWKAEIVNKMLPTDREYNKKEVVRISKESIATMIKDLFEKAEYDIEGVCFNVSVKNLTVFNERIDVSML